MTSKARAQGKPSKYIRRAKDKLARRIAKYEESIKRKDYVPGSMRKPGSQSIRKGG